MTVEKIKDGAVVATSPSDGREIGRYPLASSQQVQQAVLVARAAQKKWAAQSDQQRAACLRQVRNAFGNAAEDIVAVLSEEIGRPEAESWFAEIVANMELFDFWIKNTSGLLKPERLKLSPINYPGKKGWIEYVPQGVIGLVTPWNFPVAIPLRAIVPGLLAGNAIVWKPSEWSCKTAEKIMAIFSPHLPEGLLQVCHGLAEAGQAVVEQTDYVIFTGSVATGKKVGIRCAELGKKSSLELGGKDAAYVAADANLDRAVAGLVWGAFNNCGQNCASVERIYVHDALYEDFITRFETAVEAMHTQSYPQMGPLVNQTQATIVASQLQQAVEHGAQIASGGGGDGQAVEATMLLRVNHEMAVMEEESFGPVAPIVAVSSNEEAIEKINHSKYGLTCSLWTADYEWARQVHHKIETGVVTVNNHGFTAAIPGAPWVGVGDSGSGVTNSHIALHEMVRPRVYLEDRNKAERELWWYPYTDNAVALARLLVQTLLPGGKKPGLYLRLLKLMKNRWQQ